MLPLLLPMSKHSVELQEFANLLVLVYVPELSLPKQYVVVLNPIALL